MTNLNLGIMEQMDYATFVDIIANIPSCIFFKDTELRYRFSSHYWAQLESDDIVGKTDLEIRKDRENAVKAMEADREMIRSHKGCQYTIESDIDGEVSYLELIKEPIVDSKGNVLGIVGLINNVTEKTLMEKKIVGMSEMLEVKCTELESSNEELKMTLEKVERMYTAQKMFTASMNHELRSPLNGIIGNLGLLMEDGKLNEEEHGLVENAFVSSKLMLEIVNDLLDYAQLEMGGFKIKNEPFLLSKILDNIELQVKVQAEAKNLEFTMIRAKDLPDAFVGDATKLTQIMHNLSSNAIKYTEKGRITLGISYFNDRLIISCKDTGQGIAEESINHLFDPFVRFNENKNSHIKGTGLGLAVVKKIIDTMGGEISVSSEVGVGSTFNVILPLDIGNQDLLPRHVQKCNAESDEFDFRGFRILCVDDSEVGRVMMETMLKSVGIMVDKAANGEEGVIKADERRYDAIIMDHMMPIMDGIEAFDCIRNNSRFNSDTPIIMLTGNGDSAHAKLYREKGLNGYLIKPIMKEYMLDAIRNAVSNN